MVFCINMPDGEIRPEPTTSQERRVMIRKQQIGRTDLEQKLAIAEQDLESARNSTAGQDELPKAMRGLEIAQKRIELFTAQHDNTGVWKGDYFGRDLRKAFDDRGLESGPDGTIPSSAEDASTHFILVNMGELDRINSQGDHTSGDKALEATARAIEARISARLAEVMGPQTDISKFYDIYRTAGNDFSVRLKNVPAALAHEVTVLLSGSVDLSQAVPGQEAAPTEASMISQSEIISVLNSLAPEERSSFSKLKEGERSGVAISAVKEFLQQQNDIQKVETRFNRLAEKIRSGAPDAADFYDKFQKKALEGLLKHEGDPTVLPFSTVTERLRELGALDDSEGWRESRTRLAKQEARRQASDRRRAARDLDKTVVDAAAKRRLEIPLAQDEVTSAALKEDGTPGFVPPQDTRGAVRIKELEAIYNTEKQKSPEDAELAELNLEIEKANRDTMTGLNGRGRLFKQLETGLAAGKAITTMYIDMAFLKYFDKEGGGETGNIAIRKAAEMLDGVALDLQKQLIEETGDKDLVVDAYRIGGDEFSLAVTGGGADTAARLSRLLREREKAGGAIPLQGKKAAGAFYSQKLSFNFGTMGPLTESAMRDLLTQNGIPLKPESDPKAREELAEYALKFADKQLEYQKGFNRILLLVNEKLNGELSGDMGKFEQLQKYSEKALFGDEGKKLVEEIASKLKADPNASVQEQVMQFVVDKIRAKSEGASKHAEALDRAIDERVRELYFDQQIRGMQELIKSLEKQLTDASTVNKALSSENETLKMQIKALEQEVQTVAGLREKILSK